MKKERDILVVDDEPVVAGAVRRICSAESLRVDSADGAAAGFELLGRCSYRLIVCDIKMAGADGFDFLMQAAARHIATPIVMVTGYATVENAVRSMFSGAVDFIPKPFSADELLAVVRRGLRYDELLRDATAAALKSPPGATPYTPCPQDYRRLGHVSWAALEDKGVARVGVCDPFVRTLGGVQAVELLPAGSEVVQGRSCAAMLSDDGLKHCVMSPLSGRILETNAAAGSRRALVQKQAYAQGWLYRIQPCDPGPELDGLVMCRVDSL